MKLFEYAYSSFYSATLCYSAVYAGFLCPAVCMSVRLSQAGTVSKLLDKSSWVFLQGGLLPPIPHCVVRKVWYLQNLGLTSGNSQTPDLEIFATASRSRCQQNSSSTVELVDDTYTTAGSHGCLLQVSQL